MQTDVQIIETDRAQQIQREISSGQLIRDGVPDILRREKIVFNLRTLETHELINSLVRKLADVFNDLFAAKSRDKKHFQQELANAIDIIDALRSESGDFCPTLQENTFYSGYYSSSNIGELMDSLVCPYATLSGEVKYTHEWTKALAEISYIVNQLINRSNISEISALRADKYNRKGAFGKRILLCWVSVTK